MKELEKGDQNSKSLLANVLDLEGDFILVVSLSGCQGCPKETLFVTFGLFARTRCTT